jgi:hypothetical protein
MRPADATLRDILAAGLLAPSAENKHDLRFAVERGQVGLVPTGRAAWVAAPHRGMLALMSFGAVVENIALRSAQLGLELDLELHLHADAGAIAVLRWRERPAAAGAPDPLADALALRHTNRRFYGRDRVDASTLAALGRAAEAVAGGGVHWLDAPDERRRALRAIRLAETERFRRRALHEELFGAVRFEAGWKRTLPEWLAPATLEVELPARPMFSAMRHWGAMQMANRVGAHLMLGLRAGYLPCARAPHLGLLLAQGDDRATAAFTAGRSFQRLWLAAAAAGLALQPMAAATALARQQAGGDWVSEPTQRELQRLLASLGPGAGARPQMLFRLGRARAPSAVSGRRPLDDYLDGAVSPP